MPLSRSPQTDRRRRAIRESLAASIDYSDEARVSPSRSNRQGLDEFELPKKDRGAAYSNSVRRTCQHRLVQLIPVRKWSLIGAVLASVAVPLILVVLHYLVFVSHTLAWSGHPMSALLNAGSPRSIAAWLSSHLWLLCLAATVLTFRLRKHKLDDYEGDYRLWFWLVFTCVIGSIDSTTRLTELFGAALDRWSQVHVGWTGVAIVQATLATLIGLLGLRLCTELKSVPSSLVLWLIGLVCWAGSAALSQSILRVDISLPARDWLRASLWLGGLTAIWLSGLFYLRAIFMDAQKRFLARTALAVGNGLPWRERMMQAMPNLPRFGRQRVEDKSVEENGKEASTQSRRKKGIGSSVLLPLQSSNPTEPGQSAEPDKEIDQEYGKRRSWFQRREQPNASQELGSTPAGSTAQPSPAQSSPARSAVVQPVAKISAEPLASNRASRTPDQAEDVKASRSWSERLGLSRTKKADDGEADTRAVSARAANSTKNKVKVKARDADDAEETIAAKSEKRSWLRPKLPKISLPRPKLPKLRLPSFRLPPPGGQSVVDENASRVASNGSRPIPSTSDPVTFKPIDSESDASRGMSKAERKRLRRLQREDDGERRAA